MVSEERRRMEEIAHVLDCIEFSFSNLKSAYKDAVKHLHVRTRGDIHILEKNVERPMKAGQLIVLKYLAEADELKAKLHHVKRKMRKCRTKKRPSITKRRS